MVSGPESPTIGSSELTARRPEDYLPLEADGANRFVEDWTPIILSQLARFRLPADLAEDTAQEVLLRALRGLPRFRAESKLSTWLYTITWREGARAHQRLQRERSRAGGLVAEPICPREQDEVATRDELAAWQTRLDRLPLRQRLALGYHYLEGLSVAEIAEVMQAPTGSVKAWLKRGRDRLRAEFSWTESTQAIHAPASSQDA
jgi:RNA polymerase sigma-70 factor (ECF subfamily)